MDEDEKENVMPLARILFCAALVGSVPATPSVAQTRSPEAARRPAPPERMVCRRMPVTGNLSGKRICKAELAWRKQSEGAVESTQRLLDQGLITACTAPGGC